MGSVRAVAAAAGAVALTVATAAAASAAWQPSGAGSAVARAVSMTVPEPTSTGCPTSGGRRAFIRCSGLQPTSGIIVCWRTPGGSALTGSAAFSNVTVDISDAAVANRTTYTYTFAITAAGWTSINRTSVTVAC